MTEDTKAASKIILDSMKSGMNRFAGIFGASGQEPIDLQKALLTYQQALETLEARNRQLETELKTIGNELSQLKQERDGYKLAYETVSTDLGGKALHYQQERDGYKHAYEVVSTELAHTKTILAELNVEAFDSIKNSSLCDAPVTMRLKSTPGLLDELRAAATSENVPDSVRQILLDPEFSLEDRARYRALFRQSAEKWPAAANLISKIVEAQYTKYKARSSDAEAAQKIAAAIHERGVARLSPILTKEQIQEVRAYFEDRPILNAHIPVAARDRIRRYVNCTAEEFPIGCYPVCDVVTAPHLLNAALSPLILDAAAAYFGCTPRLSWLQAWWNFKGDSNSRFLAGQDYYHRDESDMRVFFLYIYLTDVDEESGGRHEVLARSGNFDEVRAALERARKDPELAPRVKHLTIEDLYGIGKGIPDDLKEVLFPETETFTGPAGTTFITRGIDFHRVCLPKGRNRLIFAAQFGLNEFSDQGAIRDGDRIPGRIIASRVGDDEYLRYITQARFDWEKSGC